MLRNMVPYLLPKSQSWLSDDNILKLNNINVESKYACKSKYANQNVQFKICKSKYVQVEFLVHACNLYKAFSAKSKYANQNLEIKICNIICKSKCVN